MMTPSAAGRPTVQLLHELPDGSQHVDWMIAQDSRGEAPLATFRLPQRLDELLEGEHLRAERLPDHRPLYLRYEGPIAGGRGRVRRLAEGIVIERGDGEIVVRWGDGPPQRLRLSREDGETWRIEATRWGQADARAPGGYAEHIEGGESGPQPDSGAVGK